MKPTERFSTRAESYRLHRPNYPNEIVDLLRRECNLTSNSLVVDIAAGTGLLTKIFLESDHQVIAIEPNEQMRAVCAKLATRFPQLQCFNATAEATGLPNHSVDLITVAQALHWFQLDQARAEFARILRPGGWCAVIYNNRQMKGDAFHEGYERILTEFGIDYLLVQRQHMTSEKLIAFFTPNQMHQAMFPNEQLLDLKALEGRIISSSYMPQPGNEKYPAMQAAIKKLFAANQVDGHARMQYDCIVSYGQLA